MNATIHHGDCLDVLRGMPDNSVDAVVCDPPYGLSNTSPDKVTETIVRWAQGDREYVPTGKGFMSQTWDAFVPPVAVWDECLRVLKPGGHLVAFAGSRTQDIMGLAIRLAGFDIRENLAWLYGCLDDQSEILTDNGWKRGIDLDGTEQVAQWDHNTGYITLTPVEKVHRYPFNGDMVRFVSADTDQMLTPNHRVYSQTWDRTQVDGVRTGKFSGWKVEEAGAINRYQRRRFPVAGLHDGPGIGGEDYAALLGWVFTEGGFDKNGTGVRIYQSSANPDDVAAIGALMDRMGAHKRYERTRDYTYKGNTREYTEHMWFFSGDLANKVRDDLPGKHPTHELLWAMTSAEKEAFYDASMRGDGSGNTFFQKDRDDLQWFSDLCTLTGRRSTIGHRKPPRDGGAVHVDLKDDTEVTRRNLVEPAMEHYEGEVWCVTVPTGAFVARRNGRVFITGNSGFPKSLDVGKAIDKTNGRKYEDRHALGRHIRERRESLGITRAEVNKWLESVKKCEHYESQNSTDARVPTLEDWSTLQPRLGLSEEYRELVERAEADREVIGKSAHKSGIGNGTKGHHTVGGTIAEAYNITVPATDAAKQWSGWGTALKPAHEPIILARKPFPGTVAANVLTWGTGGLNIDATRIQHKTVNGGNLADNPHLREGRKNGTDVGGTYALTDRLEQSKPHAAGRWPSNVVLDPDTAKALDQQSGTSKDGVAVNRNKTEGEHSGNTVYGARNKDTQADATYGGQGGASRFFKVADYSDIDLQNRATVADLAFEAMRARTSAKVVEPDPPFMYAAKAPKRERPSYTTEDGQTVQHSTVKPLSIMQWLVKLVTPEGGTVLDPFAGSGTTVEAAILEGFNVIGIEREAEYLPLIQQRIDRATPDDPEPEETDLLDLITGDAA